LLKNKIIKKFKENVFWLFLIELLCLSLTSVIGFFGYKEIQSRLDLINTYGPRLGELANKLQSQNLAISDVMEISNQLTSIETSTEVLRLMIIIVPLAVFLVYSFFQSISWYAISKDKFDIKKLIERKYFFGFFSISFPYFLALYLIWIFLFKILSLNAFLLASILTTLILLYFLFVSYGILHQYRSVFICIKKGLSIGFNNVGKFLPIMLGFLILFFLIFTLGTFSSSIAVYIALGVILLLVWIMFKIILTEKLRDFI